jgi:hypothetical protein
MEQIRITAVVFKEDDLWIAQCLEYNLVSCAATQEDLPKELMRQVRAQIDADSRAGKPPFFAYKPAPPKYWAMLQEAMLRSGPMPVQGIPQVEARLFPVAA